MKDPAFTILLACLAGAISIAYAIEMVKIEADYNKKSKELMKKYKR